jgi:putative intracellular protease/amidase
MSRNTAKLAFFWDKSFLWGLIAYETFRELGIRFDLLASEDIRHGRLGGYDILFVPGGWASDKIAALGDDGREQIRRYVKGGGSYFGVCGGAGLALSHESGLALTAVGRMPTSVRLPSFSGSIHLTPVAPGHPMWQGFSGGGQFHAWWPGQFSLDEAGGAEVLARYGEPAAGSFVTDLPVLPSMNWDLWKKRYGINLDPERIVGEPAVIETRFGEGRVLLSYVHFETPGDSAGHRVLLNILEYLAAGKPVGRGAVNPGRSVGRGAGADFANTADANLNTEAAMLADELMDSADDLINFGMRNFLWYQRNEWILQWRRGVRGVEYSTLYSMLRKLASMISRLDQFDEASIGKLRRLRELSQPFFSEARELLTLERNAMGHGPLSPLKTDDGQILALREKLFSNSKRCGGMYEEIIDLVDEILLPLLRLDIKTG